MLPSDKDSVMGDRHDRPKVTKREFSKEARKLGFSPQEIEHLKRLYGDKLNIRFEES
ncbi:MAG: hypothetical protein AAF423_03790 [Pseudomonadota bacterium]